jgi:flagellar basal-body rod protein FlgC
MSLDDAMKISASGMTAQGTRLRTIAENLANASSTAATAGADPYRRKLVTFQDALDQTTGDHFVKIGHIITDSTPFESKYEPGHPAADANGYVRYPNVNPLIELNDLKEAQRSYEANVDVVDASKTMLSRTIDLLKS